MANTTINGVAVISGSISMPLSGVWSADLVVDQIDGTGFDPGTSVTITTESFNLSGTVQPGRTGNFLDAIHVRVLGGAAGMGRSATARAFVQPGAYVRDVVNALVSNGGETLSSTVDTGFLGGNLTAWSIMTGTVSQALNVLLSIVAPAFNWRILSDGTLWMGVESWPSATGVFDILEQDPTQGIYDLGVESPWILPGQTIDGVGQVSRVEHSIEHNKIRSHVSVLLPEGDRGFRSSIAGIVAQQMQGINYYGLYECKVLAQSSDMTTVDVLPVVAKFAGLQRVPLRLGLPGVTAQFAPGAKVLLGWKGGDPSQPFASLHFGGETLTALTIGSAADAVATKADLSALLTAITNAVPIAQDGGAGLQKTLLAALSPPAMVPAWPVCSQTVKVQR